MIMIFKIIGGLLLVISCWGFGFYKSYEIKVKRDFLREIVLNLDKLQSEIRLCSGELFPILKRTFNSEKISFENKKFQISEKYIDRKNLQILNKMIAILGTADTLGECEKIEVYKGIFKKICDEYEKKYTADKKVWQTLGISGGIAAALLII